MTLYLINPLKQLVQNVNDEALSAFMQIFSEHRSFNIFLCCSFLETIAMNLLKKVIVYSFESLPWKIDLLLLFFRRHWLMAKELQIRALLRTTSFRSPGLLKGSGIEMIKSDSETFVTQFSSLQHFFSNRKFSLSVRFFFSRLAF